MMLGEEYDLPTWEEIAYTSLVSFFTADLLEGGEIAAVTSLGIDAYSDAGADYAALAESVIANAEKTVLGEAQLQSNLERGILEAEQQYLATVEQTAQTQTAAAETPADNGIESAVQQYVEAVEMFSSETVQESTSADVRSDVEQNTDYQVAEDTTAHTPLETMDPGELDWDAREQFSLDEDSAVSTSDTTMESTTDTESTESDDFNSWEQFSSNENGEKGESADVLEQSFLSGLQSDTESGIIQEESRAETAKTEQTAEAPETTQAPMAEREQLALSGTELLDKGGMPSPKQLDAMGIDEATARGYQSRVWLSTESDPAARRAVEAMIDRTAPEALQIADNERTQVSAEDNFNNNLGNTIEINSHGAAAHESFRNKASFKLYSPVEYIGTVRVNGEVRDVSRRVYQRSDISVDYIDETTGMSNLERMQAGKPPIGSDGYPIQLHHVLQMERGPMAELREVTHQQYYSQLHGWIASGFSFRNDPTLNKQYNNFRHNYWKWRAEQFLGGR